MQAPLNKNGHATHCLRSLHGLPGKYAAADTSRVAISFYCLGALDILGLLDAKTSEDEREEWKEWIWAQQISYKDISGFRPSPYMDIDGGNSELVLHRTDPPHDLPHLVMTYTAILCLAIFRDDFSRLDRSGLVNLLRNTQQEDGCFSAMPGHAESDIRLIYTAFAICSMLDDWSGVDIEKAVAFIRRCRTYEGGYGQTPFAEGNGGPTYCALASLLLIPLTFLTSPTLTPDERKQTLHWLVHNQVSPDSGFRGRTEKVADVCYNFWCGASLKIIGAEHLVNEISIASFIQRCQFRFGGIAKAPNDMPDPYHTYLSLASLAMYPPATDDAHSSWTTLPKLDPLLNATEDTARWIKTHVPRSKAYPSFS